VTFNHNIADQYGGGMYNDDSSLRLENSILWGDQAADGAEIYNTNLSIPLIAYSDIEAVAAPKPGTIVVARINQATSMKTRSSSIPTAATCG